MQDGTVNRVTIQVFGAFRVTGPDGCERTPASAKGQALLALLVTAPNRKRTRSWLQDKLWSLSDPAHGAASLRQVLATLRRALGPAAPVLQADRRTVWLDADALRTDWEDGRAREPASFLEGIDIDDPEFAAWLSQIRNAPAPGVPDRYLPAPPPHLSRRWRVALASAAASGQPAGALAAHLEAELLACLSRSLTETGIAEIAAGGSDPHDPWAIDVGLSIAPIGDNRYGVRLSVMRPARRRVLWSVAEALTIAPTALSTDPALMALIASAQAAILREVSREAGLTPGLAPEARVLARSAQSVFSFDAVTLARTDAQLAELEDGPDRGVVLGMRAQISVIRDIERLTAAPEALAEQGLDQAAKAVEADPFNSQVLAAAANAQVFLKWDIDTGAELARLALEANRTNPLAWWADANVALYTQSFDRALDSAETATRLARGTPLQFWCQFQLGLAALAGGHFERARRSLETSAAIAPSFRPPRRYLLALYSHLGQFDRAARVARDLARLEQGFSLDAFARDTDYPVSLARRVGLIDAAALGRIDYG